jgi:hypothetical protein
VWRLDDYSKDGRLAAAGAAGSLLVDRKEKAKPLLRSRAARVIAVSALVVAMASQLAVAARSSTVPDCATSAIQLRIDDQGTSGSAVIGILARARARCALAGVASLSILQAGRRASVKGNPLALRLKGVLVPLKSRLAAHAWWIGWCNSRKGLRLVVRYRTLVVRVAPQYVPRCDSRAAGSRLVAVR